MAASLQVRSFLTASSVVLLLVVVSGAANNSCDFDQPPCGLCGRNINVTLIARNNLVPPTFELAASITNEYQRALLAFLEKACSINKSFKFESTFYAGLGYFIDSINGVRGSIPSKTFWHISSNGVSADCGVSSYIPVNGETILFNFTTYQDSGYDF
ncbi:cobalamin binding intrinsic factor-like [Physella acuta]|uniref:cobalamin binding intrinsic factor-like n=1 Tax=Physella acuta TaxID=109671 RepID=UPI0027DB1BFC|nr:cobalamin binding intrinsic factor-like [Physella acuta]